MQKDWNEFEESNFKFKIIEKTNKKDLLLREQYWTNIHKSFNVETGYNKRVNVTCNLNIKHNQKTRDKISKGLKGKMIGNKNPMHKSNYTYTEEVKQKMSESHKGAENYMYGKGYILQGEKNGRAKLKEKDVFEIRELLKNKVMMKDIAEIYGVSSTSILRIKKGTSWKYLI